MATQPPTKSYDLANFHLSEILYNNSKNKSVCVLGNFIVRDDVVSPVATDDAVDGTVAATVADAGANGQPHVEQAIIILEKLAFTEHDVCTNNTGNISDESTNANETEDRDDRINKRILFTSDTKLKQLFVNDIYGNFECYPNADLNSN